MLNSRCKPEKFLLAKRLRNRMTHTERMLWRQLKASKIGVPFRRQALMLGFIADFYCPSRRLIVEVDGSSHRGRERYDANRDRIFDQNGIRTIRLTAEEVIGDVMSCVGCIKEIIEKIPPFRTNLPRSG